MEQSPSDPPPLLAPPHPPIFFLENETDQDAGSLIGSFTHDIDYQICLTASEEPGNHFVYNSKYNGRPFRAFIVGTISGLTTSTNSTNQNAVTQHISIQCLLRGTDKARTFFYNDIFTLRATLEAEAKNVSDTVYKEPPPPPPVAPISHFIIAVQDNIITRKWCVADEEQESNNTVYVEFSHAAKCVHGPFAIGSNVLVDVSMHRADLRVEGTVTRTRADEKSDEKSVIPFRWTPRQGGFQESGPARATARPPRTKRLWDNVIPPQGHDDVPAVTVNQNRSKALEHLQTAPSFPARKHLIPFQGQILNVDTEPTHRSKERSRVGR
ncbi:hypothetical protein C8R47DRAFT_1327395 [Mycena vitilis]|nr:hypothetical protein C8R47DRAFT_1327395 [Mycena vitilis]